MRNPYVAPATQTYNDAATDYATQQQQQHSISSSHLTQPPSGTRALSHQTSAGSLTLQYGGQGSSGLPVPATQPNPPSSSYYPSTRARANTINQMDVVPPALARLSQMGSADATGIGRNALTPVMQREDAMREWERRQSGKAHPPPQTYPQLEFLQQQAELATTSGGLNWTQSGSSGHRYAPSNLSFQTQPSALGDQDRTTVTMRDAVMSSVRSAARQDTSNSLAQAGVISTPPQAYSTNAAATGSRYTASYQQPPASYETPGFDGRNEPSSLYMPAQPQQYQSYGNAAASPHAAQQPGISTRHNVAPPASSVNHSFYGAGVVPTGQPFSDHGSPNPAQGLSKDARRISGMDVWQR